MVLVRRGDGLADRVTALADRLGLDGVGGAALAEIERLVVDLRAQRAAAEQRAQRLDRALAQVDDGLVLADAAGEIVYRNEPAEAYRAARHGEALVERLVVGLLQRALDGSDAADALELWGPPRRSLVVRARALVDDDGTLLGAIARIQDRSAVQRVEEMRRDFVSNIGHELKTPVGALGLLSDALVDEDDPATVARLAERLQFESHRLARIVEDLLDLSRLESDDPTERGVVDLGGLVAAAVDHTRTRAEHAGIAITVTVAVDGADRTDGIAGAGTVEGDRRQLATAMQNLLENAIKYSDRGSTVRVRIDRGNGSVLLSVADEGIGIPTRDLERIFERFYRVDRARARDTGGTGLGLSIVRHVARNHGGDVTVTSREGAGSCFTLHLPTTPLDAVLPAAPATPPQEA